MKKIYAILFSISIITTLIAGYFLINHGLKLGVDFKGGSVIELQYSENRPEVGVISKALEVSKVQGVSVTPSGDKDLIIRSATLNEDQHQQVLNSLKAINDKFTEKRFDSIGPSLGEELRSNSVIGIAVLIGVIMLYISIVFRTMGRVISPWAMGVAALFALIHDVIISLGIFSFLGFYYGVEISAVYVAVALTILSYSISDTVVVFDRVRENIIRFGGRDSFLILVHKSILQTLTRSINSSMTTILALLAIYIFGGESIKFFAMALIIGIALGTYSSIFVASPVLMWWGARK